MHDLLSIFAKDDACHRLIRTLFKFKMIKSNWLKNRMVPEFVTRFVNKGSEDESI